jgi:hypothetical protein
MLPSEPRSEKKKVPPDCRYCKRQAVWADAGIMKSIPYFYCRRCKAEIDEDGGIVLPPPPVPESTVELPEPYTDEDGPRFDAGQFFFSNH